MREIEAINGSLSGSGRRFGIVASRFNGRLVENLVEGAIDCLLRHGAAEKDMVVVRVPGAWEIPAALESLAAGRDLDALIALGAVVRGETPHFDYICAESSRGIAAVSERHGMAIGFGVLTCDTTAQAEERAGGKAGNKGWDAALAALEMADLLQRLQAK